MRDTKAQSGAEVFKRWSLLEEAAGNLLEAAVQAEIADDYFAASLLFRKGWRLRAGIVGAGPNDARRGATEAGRIA